MKPLLTLCALLILHGATARAADVSGRVTDPDGHALPGVTLTTNVAGVGTLSDSQGEFTLRATDEVEWVTFSSIGYQSRQIAIGAVPREVVLEPRYYQESDIIVTGDRARSGITPIAFDNFSEKDIKRDYTVGEFPLLLENTTNLYAFSDAGTPLGYSYVRIRGFDDKRIATYINGVPLNDPEDQATYFTDLPDFAANITDIQVQRGVGNSLYGDASFGGSINIVTNNLSEGRKVTLTSGWGSYTVDNKLNSDIAKGSLEYSSGLVNGRWLFTGRYSNQRTGGYRENSWYNGWSYYLSLARLDPNMTTQLYVYGGPMRMHLAYWGASLDAIAADRRYNPLSYDNETDNFNQPHYHLHNIYRLSDRATLSNTLYYIRGQGYYEQLKSLESAADFAEYGLDSTLSAVVPANLVRQQWVYKNQWGWNPRLDIEHAHGSHSLGGSFYYFNSDHWGQVVWAEGITDPNFDPRQRYYQYYGRKWASSLFAEEYYRLTDRFAVQPTAQIRYQRYSFNQDKRGPYKGYDYTVDWFFFSPRLGLNYQVSDNISVFTNAAISSRTPTDASIYDANDPYVQPSLVVRSVSADSTQFVFGDPTARAERVYDFELGSQFRAARSAFGMNLFWMEFRNEIIPYGGVNDDGLLYTTNADRSVHAGIETNAAVEPVDGLRLSGNLSFNYNRIKEFTADIDGYMIDFSGKTVSGFPDYLGNVIGDYQYRGARITWRNQFVGKQYMDLNNIDSLAIKPYYTSSLSISYTLSDFVHVGQLTLAVRVDNLFNNDYLVSGYGGDYAYDDNGTTVVGGWGEYYVAAERSFFSELKLEMF